jgi:23S rRNA (adenine2503-C2)-methyltransferase
METMNLLNFSSSELIQKFKELGMPSFLGKQVFDWLYRKEVIDIDLWSNISKSNREFLKLNFKIELPKIIWEGHSQDGTKKFLLQLEDKNTIETVLIPMKDRLTLCISSQVGCAIGCTFCHTGTQGLKRHLKTAEITGQFYAVSLWIKKHIDPDSKITNIVYMGQGEPLHNFENVKRATLNFMDVHGWAMGQRRITLSTSGLVPQIEKLIDFPPVNIAISLHSAKDDVRTELMPINKVYDLKRLFNAIRTIPVKAHRRITYEYLLIDGLNDQESDIEALTKLLNSKESKINLIPFNEYPGSDFKKPSPERVYWFMSELIKNGYTCTVRVTKGDDILAACGQLKSMVEKKLNVWNPEVLKDINTSSISSL